MNEEPDTIRALIQHENEMTNHRMNWFLILQGFMFAGIAFAWDKSTALCVVFSIVGILSSISVGILLRYGIQAIRDLDRKSRDTTIGKGSEEIAPFMHFLLPWHFLPFTMIVAWTAMIIIKLAKIV
ncbi:hypothetical protein TSL6_04680 [Sulfurovum sp. TSL6]|uniref:hypothetical protein n=1 Tax=Sulfurovum sp. TSL6 TaxID=2826995 RepID=UPI001CC595A8|nr:hypothetical protein [Sulfurovum sp. TSL6]GIT99961.1 hypothetical protein TSL6_04680 [Sulfurovum sp. TSL6]